MDSVVSVLGMAVLGLLSSLHGGARPELFLSLLECASLALLLLPQGRAWLNSSLFVLGGLEFGPFLLLRGAS